MVQRHQAYFPNAKEITFQIVFGGPPGVLLSTFGLALASARPQPLLSTIRMEAEAGQGLASSRFIDKGPKARLFLSL